MTQKTKAYSIDISIAKSDFLRALDALVKIHGSDVIARCTVSDRELSIEGETELCHDSPPDCTLADCERCKTGMRNIRTRYGVPLISGKKPEGYHDMLIPCKILSMAVSSLIHGDIIDITCEGSRTGQEDGRFWCYTNRSEEIWISESGAEFSSIEINNCIPL
jgi:hypothetical protein